MKPTEPKKISISGSPVKLPGLTALAWEVLDVPAKSITLRASVG